jgi:hypothetical protein
VADKKKLVDLFAREKGRYMAKVQAKEFQIMECEALNE